MPTLLLYLLKANGALLLFAGLYYVALRRLTFYGLNRWYLLGAIFFSALYPLVDIAVLWSPPAALSNDLIVWQSAWHNQTVTAASPVDYYEWMVALYWTGVVVLSARLLIQGLSLWRLHRASAPTEGLLFRQLTEAVTPFSFWQTIYLNPEQHRPAELSAILLHEQVHVRQWHTLDVLLGQLQRVFCWLNPAAWLLLRAVQENLEFIADRAVLRGGQVDSKEYQYSLVRLSTLALGPALVTSFTFHTLKNRIKMMNSPKTSAIHMARYLLVAPLVVTLLLGSCSKAEQEPAVNALYFIDGEKSTKQAVEQLSPKAIASVSVRKGERVSQQLGEAAAAGAILVTTTANENSTAVKAFNEQFTSPNDSIGSVEDRPAATNRAAEIAEALIFIDGKEATEAELKQLPASRIKEMRVLKGELAEQQYGVRGRNGAVVVVTGAKGTGGLTEVHERNGVMSVTK